MLLDRRGKRARVGVGVGVWVWGTATTIYTVGGTATTIHYLYCVGHSHHYTGRGGVGGAWGRTGGWVLVAAHTNATIVCFW